MQRPSPEDTRFDSNRLAFRAQFGMLVGMRRIIHSCGHEQEHYIIGEYAADYDRQAAKLSQGKCAVCSTKAAALTAVQTRAAALELGLASLEGSPKQIAWAETILAKRITALQRGNSETVMIVARITDAKWWIDHRSDADDGLVASARAYLSVDVSAREDQSA